MEPTAKFIRHRGLPFQEVHMRKRGRKPRCPYCRSSHTISKGTRPTATMGKRLLRVCRDCKRKFTIGRRLPEQKPIPSTA